MKQEKVALKTLGIKATVYNRIRTFLYKQHLDKISDQTKIEFFNEIYGLNSLAHRELNAYKSKRKDAKALYKARVARGYKFKKKTSLEDYKKSLVETK